MKRILQIGALALGGALTLGGCYQQDSAPSMSHGEYYPVTVENCGAEVLFESEPQRLVMLKPASAAALQSIGVLDRAVARAGAFDEEYFDEATNLIIDDIPELAGDLDPSGHLHISADVVIDQQPDLVLGEVENLPRQQLNQLNLPLIEEPALCQTNSGESPSWESVYEQIRTFGEVFNRAEMADEATAELQDRVAALQERVPPEEDRTAAVLYPTVGGGPNYAYGTSSMSHPQLETAGFTNVFGDVSDRVFEVTAEELIGRDPDVLILLYSEGTPEDVEQSVTSMPGADQITAIQDGEILTQLMNFSEPATPLTVEGLERIIDRFHE